MSDTRQTSASSVASFSERHIFGCGHIDNSNISARPIGMRTFNYDFMAFNCCGRALLTVEQYNICEYILPNTVVFIPKNITHIYDPVDQASWSNYWLLFNTDRFVHSSPALIPQNTIITVGSPQIITEVFDKMILYLLMENNTDNISSAYLHCLLAHVREEEINNQSELYHVVKKEMCNNISSAEINIKNISLSHNITMSTLKKKFKSEVNVPLHQFFLNLKIEAAKSMLINPTYKIFDIASALGFKDAYYFSRLFKKKTGYSPRDYRSHFFKQPE